VAGSGEKREQTIALHVNPIELFSPFPVLLR
jgi:hypothetical protein